MPKESLPSPASERSDDLPALFPDNAYNGLRELPRLALEDFEKHFHRLLAEAQKSLAKAKTLADKRETFGEHSKVIGPLECFRGCKDYWDAYSSPVKGIIKQQYLLFRETYTAYLDLKEAQPLHLKTQAKTGFLSNRKSTDERIEERREALESYDTTFQYRLYLALASGTSPQKPSQISFR